MQYGGGHHHNTTEQGKDKSKLGVVAAALFNNPMSLAAERLGPT